MSSLGKSAAQSLSLSSRDHRYRGYVVCINVGVRSRTSHLGIWCVRRCAGVPRLGLAEMNCPYDKCAG